MFGMNPVQIEGQVKIFMGFFGGIAAALGWTWFGSVSQAFLDAIGPVLAAVGPVTYFAAAIWSVISKKNANIVSNAAAVPGVGFIELKNTAEGRALAPVTPSNVNVTASPLVGPTGIGSGMR